MRYSQFWGHIRGELRQAARKERVLRQEKALWRAGTLSLPQILRRECSAFPGWAGAGRSPALPPTPKRTFISCPTWAIIRVSCTSSATVAGKSNAVAVSEYSAGRRTGTRPDCVGGSRMPPHSGPAGSVPYLLICYLRKPTRSEPDCRRDKMHLLPV